MPPRWMTQKAYRSGMRTYCGLLLYYLSTKRRGAVVTVSEAQSDRQRPAQHAKADDGQSDHRK
jgi:hypothetical protein